MIVLNYDVVVVGGGPSGSTTAKIAAQRGFKVLVLEKGPLDREKPCGGAVTNRVVEDFKIPKKAFVRNCSGIFLCCPKNRIVVIGKGNKIRLTMRSVFDKVLCQMALDKGVNFFENALVKGPVIKNGKVIGVRAKIDGKLSTVKARLVVGADGTPSTLARGLGLFSGDSKSLGFCFQYQMKLSNEDIEERFGGNVEVYYGTRWVPSGYVWVFPKDGLVSVGCVSGFEVIKQGRINLRGCLDHFIRKHPIASTKLGGSRIVLCQAHFVGYPGVLRDNVVDGCLIVGDASGTVSVFNSEGIWYSMKSGEAAGKSVTEVLEKEDLSAGTIRSRYIQYLDQKVKNDLSLASKLFRFGNSDIKMQRIIELISKDQWWVNLTQTLMDGTCSYRKALKQIRKRPDKMLQARILLR